MKATCVSCAMKRTVLTICVLYYVIASPAGSADKMRGQELAETKDPSGRFVAYEQYVEESKLWHSLLGSVLQDGDSDHGAKSSFQLVSTNASFDAEARRPAIPTRVTIGFEYRPCHQSELWRPAMTLYADGRYVCDITLHAEFCQGGLGRETEFGTAEIAFDDFRRLARAVTLAVRVNDVETELNPSAGQALRWFVAWQLGEESQ